MKRLFALAVILIQTSAVCMADDWMSQLDDNTYLSQVSIPGTHDSATGEGWTGFLGELAGESMGLTQHLTIAQQLECGIRAFDLRPCVVDGQLVINHGILQTKAVFPETLKQLCQFVTDHPTEFIVVVMRHESDGDDNSSQWKGMMRDCLNNDDVRQQLADYKRDITVGELRGKVLVLTRDQYAETPIGGLISGWKHQADYATGTIKGPVSPTGVVNIQDFYEVMNNMTAKLNGIVKLLNYSTANNVYKASRHLVMCINCASGYTESASSDGNRDNAAQCNKKIIDYLADESHWGPTGIIFMDFAGTDTSNSYEVKGMALVNAIISNNQRYVPVKKGDDTGIITLRKTTKGGGKRYNLSGQPVSDNYRGITISCEGNQVYR